MEIVLTSGGRPPKPDKLTACDVCDLWEDPMKVYLEAIDEGERPAAILSLFDSEVYAVAGATHPTVSLTPATIFERLRLEFGRTKSVGIAHLTLEECRQHAG
ncbi:hypothetical protein SprV_0501996500 [Sparganum proliferum]